MDLQNLTLHMRGKSIKVNGRAYRLDAQGVARDVATEDAVRLLGNREVWQRYVERTPVAPLKAELKKAVSLPPVSPPAPEPTKAEQLPAATQELSGEPVEPEQVEYLGGQRPSPDALAGLDEDEEETTEEWPDPTEDMNIEYLRRMADAYEVRYTGRTGKPRLIKDIVEAMYPPD